MKLRTLFPILLILALLLTIATGPPLQSPPDPSQFIVYGAPWVLVGIVIIGLLRRYAKLQEEGSVLISAGWAVVGYLLIQNLPDIETVAPWLPKYLPQALWAVLIFGAQLGLVPGATARKAIGVLRR